MTGVQTCALPIWQDAVRRSDDETVDPDLAHLSVIVFFVGSDSAGHRDHRSAVRSDHLLRAHSHDTAVTCIPRQGITAVTVDTAAVGDIIDTKEVELTAVTAICGITASQSAGGNDIPGVEGRSGGRNIDVAAISRPGKIARSLSSDCRDLSGVFDVVMTEEPDRAAVTAAVSVASLDIDIAGVQTHRKARVGLAFSIELYISAIAEPRGSPVS